MKLRKNLTTLLLGATILLTTGCNEKTEIVAASEQYIQVGANWAELANLKGNKEYKIKIKSKSDKYKVGDKLSFDVISKKSGFLYVLYTNEADETIWLYPNEQSNYNNIKKSQKFTMPPKDGAWQIEATPPAGKSLLSFFIFTDEEKAQSFFETHSDEKSYSKDLMTVAKKNDYGVTSIVVEVVEEDEK